MEQKNEKGFAAYIVLIIVFLLSILVIWLGFRLYSRYSSTFSDYFQLFFSTSFAPNPSSNLRFDSPPPISVDSATPTNSAKVVKEEKPSAKRTFPPATVPSLSPTQRQAASIPRAEPAVISNNIYKK